MGEFVALLVTVTLPAPAPAVDGVYVTLSVVLCPGVRISPVETPLAANPGPAMLTLETVTSEFPALVNFTLRLLVLLMLTLGKVKSVVLALSRDVAAVTVSVAGLLVILPMLLLTVTVYAEPLSETVVAGAV